MSDRGHGCGAACGGPSRRQVLTWAGAGAAAVALASCGSDEPETVEPPPAGEPLVELDRLAVGASLATTTADGAGVIIHRVSESEVVAFSSVCTHQGCTVLPEPERLYCPCHGSVYDPASGEVLDGPAPRPLPEIPVQITDSIITTA